MVLSTPVTTLFLGEISVVSLGADSTTSARIAAKAAKGKAIMAEEKKEDEKPDFTAFCKAAGCDPATMSDEHKTGMTSVHAKLYASDDSARKTTTKRRRTMEDKDKAEASRRESILEAAHKDAMNDAKIKAQVAETCKRIASIQARCAGHAEICAKALAGDWDDNKIDLEILRASRVESRAVARRSRCRQARRPVQGDRGPLYDGRASQRG